MIVSLTGARLTPPVAPEAPEDCMRANLIIPILFLLAILMLLAPALQRILRGHLRRRPLLLFAGPAVLSAVFLIILWRESVLGVPLAALILAYTFLPAAAAFRLGSSPPQWLDMAAIALLWLPLELGAGAMWIPK
ncbi:MAG: hypothetical protein ABIZ80_21205, partial [Bryobacteraceae bacterium]